MDCLGEEFAIRLIFLMDISSCVEEESEIVLTSCMAQVRAGLSDRLQDRRLDEVQMTRVVTKK